MSIVGYSATEARALHPPLNYDKIRHLKNYIHEGKESKGRKIFYKVNYTHYENDHIAKFEDAMRAQNLPLPEE